MMNQEGFVYFFYFFPQFNCQDSSNIQNYQQTFHFINEDIQQNKKIKFKEDTKEEIFSNHSLKQISHPKNKIKHKDQQNNDSSFFLPEKQQYKTTEQKLGRNSSSNILRLFTKLLRTPEFKQKYSQVRQKFGFEMCFKQFNSWIAGIGLNMNKYVRFKKILNGVRSKPNIGRILSILYSIFEYDYARTAALTSCKTESKNIIPTLTQIRTIREEINEAVLEGFNLISPKTP